MCSNIQVLQVTTGERNVCDDLELAIANLRDGDIISEVVCAAFNLDAVVQELLECGKIENLVADRLAAVDGVLAPVSYCHKPRICDGVLTLEVTLVLPALPDLPRVYIIERKTLAYCSLRALTKTSHAKICGSGRNSKAIRFAYLNG
jgi:hypothetical protein